MLPGFVLTILPVTLPSPVTCMSNVPAARSVRFVIPENVPERFVTVPVFAPFNVHVAPVAFSVPVLAVSCRLPMPENEPERFVTVPAFAPVIVQVAVASFSMPVPVSCRLPMPENEPERFVTVPAFALVIVQVALVAFSVPLAVSVMFSNEVQLTVPLLPASAPVMV